MFKSLFLTFLLLNLSSACDILEDKYCKFKSKRATAIIYNLKGQINLEIFSDICQFNSDKYILLDDKFQFFGQLAQRPTNVKTSTKFKDIQFNVKILDNKDIFIQTNNCIGGFYKSIDDVFVISNYGVGGVFLNQSLDTVLKNRKFKILKKYKDIVVLKDKSGLIEVILDSAGVKEIRVFSAKFKTIHNIGVGNTFADLQRYFDVEDFTQENSKISIFSGNLVFIFEFEHSFSQLKSNAKIKRIVVQR